MLQIRDGMLSVQVSRVSFVLKECTTRRQISTERGQALIEACYPLHPTNDCALTIREFKSISGSSTCFNQSDILLHKNVKKNSGQHIPVHRSSTFKSTTPSLRKRQQHFGQRTWLQNKFYRPMCNPKSIKYIVKEERWDSSSYLHRRVSCLNTLFT
jgi:hypothetical protein